jgi:predicted esterase
VPVRAFQATQVRPFSRADAGDEERRRRLLLRWMRAEEHRREQQNRYSSHGLSSFVGDDRPTNELPRTVTSCKLSGMVARREAIRLMAGGAAAMVFAPWATEPARGLARLSARPSAKPSGTVAPGLSPLGLESPRDGLLFVPSGYTPAKPLPLVLSLHGASGSAKGAMERARAQAEARGFLVLAVDSRDGTWDAIRSEFGPDVAFINRALQYTFDRYAVDPERIAVLGFSDGASYALGLGLPNGDLFRRIIAFSPGMIPSSETPDHGKPPVFLSHGTQDPILPIERTSRILVRGLKRDGYDVTFVEFEGVHTVPPQVLTQAMDWWL